MGAVVCDLFRERPRMTALQGAAGASPVPRAGSFERGPTPQGRQVESDSMFNSARFRDMGCPSLLGRGKSTGASGRYQWGSTRLSKPSDPWPEEARSAADR